MKQINKFKNDVLIQLTLMTLEDYLSEHPKKYLIFDLDLTLARLEINWSHIHEYLFAEVSSIDPALASSPSTNAREFYSLINRVSEKYGERAKERLDDLISTFEVKNYSGYTPNIGLLSFIKSKSQTYQFSLWTSNTSKTIDDFIQKERLTSLFDHIITIDIVKYAKPHPDGFYKIFNKMNLKSEYLMVGDSDNDADAAKAAEIDFYKECYFDRH